MFIEFVTIGLLLAFAAAALGWWAHARFAPSTALPISVNDPKTQFQSLITNIPAAVYRCSNDEDWTMIFISEYIEQLCGFSAETFVGNASRSFASIIHPQDRAGLNQAIQTAIAKRTHWTYQYRIIDNQQQIHWVKERGRAQYDHQQQALWLDGAIHDVTQTYLAQLQLSASEAHFRALFHHAGIAIATLNDKAQIIRLNERLCQFAQTEPQQLVNQSFSQLLPIEDRAAFIQAIQPLISGEQQHFAQEIRYQKSDGHRRWADLRLVRLEHTLEAQGRFTLMATMSDITERTQLNEALRKTVAIAEQANQAKSDFLANMSHEIRTPMNAIIGLTQLCLQEPPSEPTTNYLKKIDSASRSLMQLLNDVLDFSKIEADRLELESAPFQLDELFQALDDLFSLQAKQKGLELIFTLDPTLPSSLIGDSFRLKQVLINLINNALKFTQQGKIELSLSPIMQPSEQVQILFSVRDSGIGISEQQQARLFQSFVQADSSTTRQYGGTGLGLTISQRLVNLMGGQIKLSSIVDQGSCFEFALTFQRADTLTDKVATPNTAQSFSGQPILLVEDNPINQELTLAVLEQFGLSVILAADGVEALACLDKHTVDLILMDCQMPNMDGFEATRQIRNRGLDLPIIAMTAYASHENQQRCFDAGMNGHLSKPIELPLLQQVLSQYLTVGDNPTPSKPVSSHPLPPTAKLAKLKPLLVDFDPLVLDMAHSLKKETPHSSLMPLFQLIEQYQFAEALNWLENYLAQQQNKHD